jgi:hypothetical protein
LIPLDAAYEEKYDLGFMHLLVIAIGLLEDAPEMGRDHYKSLKDSDYPDIFKD